MERGIRGIADSRDVKDMAVAYMVDALSIDWWSVSFSERSPLTARNCIPDDDIVFG